jgi:hypothetical protein
VDASKGVTFGPRPIYAARPTKGRCLYTDGDSLLQDMATYQRRLRAVLEKEKKAASAWLAERISEEALEQVRALVRAERAHCEEMIELAKGRLKALDRVAVTVKSMEALGQKIGAKLDQADFARRRWMLGQMCAIVRINPDQKPPDDVELEVSLDAVVTPAPDTDIVDATPGRSEHNHRRVLRLAVAGITG